MSGLIDSIKNDVKKVGTNKSKFIYFREGQKIRVRFLTDMDDGMEITFHDSFEKGVNVPCQELFGRECPYCDDDGLRTRSQYVWSVYNYETKEVQLFMFPVNNCSPVPALLAMHETYGTLLDRDYVISVSGKQQNKTYSVVPMDKARFRLEKVKPYSEQAVLKMLDKAYPAGDVEDDEDDAPRKPVKGNNKRRSAPEPDEDDYDDDEQETTDYEEMSPKELYQLCKERKLDVLPKKPAKYYIKQLEEYDKAQDDWDDEENEDDWEDE